MKQRKKKHKKSIVLKSTGIAEKTGRQHSKSIAHQMRNEKRAATLIIAVGVISVVVSSVLKV